MVYLTKASWPVTRRLPMETKVPSGLRTLTVALPAIIATCVCFSSASMRIFSPRMPTAACAVL